MKKNALLYGISSAHTTLKKLAREMNTMLAVISGGLTSQLQPIDVSINKPFKNNICEEWSKNETILHASYS